MKTNATVAVVLCPPTARWRALGGMVSNQEWPPEVLKMIAELGGDLNSPYTKWPVFLLPAQFDVAQRAVQELRAMGMPPVLEYGTIGNPSANNIASVKWYSLMYPESDEGFVTQGMFEMEWPCELPTPELVTGVHGCSLNKKQVRKIKLSRSRRIAPADFRAAATPFYSFPWQTLVVSARVRNALQDSGFTGFAFLPVAGEQASAEESMLAAGPCHTDSVEWFQWVIDGRSGPRPITDFIPVRRPLDGRHECRICGRKIGDAQRTPLFEESVLNEALDVQVCDEFGLPDGRRIMNEFGGELIVSSRFVEFCIKNKFKGLSTIKGRAPNFLALYFGPSV